MAYTLEEYVQETQAHQQYGQRVDTFRTPQGNSRMLEVNFGVPNPATGQALPMVWLKAGSMVAYTGEVSFVREGMFSHGVKHALKKAVTEEGATLMKATPKGPAQLYLAEQGKIVTIIRLHGDSITVNGNDLLAFEPSITHKIVMMKKVSSIVSGGLFNVQLAGHGFVAVTSHGNPICFTVGQGLPPVFTDPDATVAWTGTLSPEFKTDVQFKTLLGRGSGESFQMKFDGNRGPPGIVLVQPFEEVQVAKSSSSHHGSSTAFDILGSAFGG